MRVDALYWDSVRIICERDPSKSRTLGRCWVEVEDGRLVIRNLEDDRGDAVHFLLAKAQVKAIGLLEMRISAQWFLVGVGDNEEATFLPVEVVCAF